MHYTTNQTQAIRHRDGNLLILACAGSGKTEVISRRIAEFVSEGVAKDSVIAFTFTERAARELKARVRRHLEALVPENPSLGDMYVGTIHSFCLQLLKEIDPSYRKFEVMDEARQAALVMTRFHISPDGSKGIGLNRLRGRTRSKRYWDTVRTFLRTLSVMHQGSITTDAVDDVLRDCIERYQKLAYGPPNYFFDFDHIIGELLARLRADEEALESVRSRFRHVVVDEYQDVDDRQEELIRLISDGGTRVQVTAVGDDDQAIYGFRGAEITNILSFSDRYPNVSEIRLQENFRSTHAIVEIANGAIRKIPPARRTTKSMQARRWQETPGAFAETMAQVGDVQVRKFPSEEAEAEWVADRLQQLHGTLVDEKDGGTRAIDWADMVILLRSVRNSGADFAAALHARQIPYVVKGTGGLFDHDEVLLVQAGFCLLARAQLLRDDGESVRMLDEPETRAFARDRITGLRASGAMPEADASRFLEWVAEEREKLDRRMLEKDQRGRLARRIYPQDLFHDMLACLGSAASEEPWQHSVLYNLGRLSALITQFEAVHQWVTPRDLGSLCLFLGGWAAGQVDEGGHDESGAPNAVQIMTVHAAKGLEWPVVFLPRMASGQFPSRFRTRGPETFLEPNVFDPADYASGDDGERRLWYVALTRCRQFLHVTSPDRKGRKPSPFLTEVHHDMVQRDGAVAPRAHDVPIPPVDAELLPTTYSDLSYFWRCPFEYQLRALMGFGPGVKESYGYGQQIHNILAEVHLRAQQGTTLTRAEVEDLVERRFHLRYTRDGTTFQPLTELRKAAKMSISRYLESFPDSATCVLHSEKPFEFVDAESGALISGTIDLLERVDGHTDSARSAVAVVDFKTHRWKDRKTYERAREDVTRQLRLYAIAAGHALHLSARQAKAHFLSPKPPTDDQRRDGMAESFAVDISDTHLDAARAEVREAVAGVRASLVAKRFELKGCATGACRHCDYRVFCPGYRKYEAAETTLPVPGSPADDRVDEILRVIEELDAGNSPK